jgi:hypothetical protein
MLGLGLGLGLGRRVPADPLRGQFGNPALARDSPSRRPSASCRNEEWEAAKFSPVAPAGWQASGPAAQLLTPPARFRCMYLIYACLLRNLQYLFSPPRATGPLSSASGMGPG